LVGKKIRMDRLFDRNSGRTVIVPMDHGVTLGPVQGLIRMQETIDAVAAGGTNAIVIHKGCLETSSPRNGRPVSRLIHLSASTKLTSGSNTKIRVCTVEEAIKLGADGVSVHVNLGAEDERLMLKDLGDAATIAMEWGMPLLAMMYVRGPGVANEYDVNVVKHAARVGAELGADIVKVPYTGSPESFREVVEGCFVPVVIAGGEKMETDEDVLDMVRGAVAAGAAGVSIGRNVFQHQNPREMVQAIAGIVHNGG
jgi:class I fructose-bisphosphate aldolase